MSSILASRLENDAPFHEWAVSLTARLSTLTIRLSTLTDRLTTHEFITIRSNEQLFRGFHGALGHTSAKCVFWLAFSRMSCKREYCFGRKAQWFR